jgi:hypothetical protein
MYYYFITVAGNSKCVATNDTYSPTVPVDGDCSLDLDTPAGLTLSGNGLVNCNDNPGDPPRKAKVYTDKAAAAAPMAKIVFLFATLLLLSTGCTTVKRYRSVDQTTKEPPISDTDKSYDEKNLRVRMEVSDVKISPPDVKPTYKSLWDLGNNGQKQLLAILTDRFKDNDKFLAALNNKYLSKADDDDNPVIDLTKKKVRIVFTISRWHPYDLIQDKDYGFTPADRIEYLKYRLNLNDPNSSIHFTNWNKYTTEYGSIDIADLSFQQSVTASAGYGDTTAGLNASVSGTASRTENQKVKYRYIQLNGRIGSKFLELESEGTREIDLSGNVMADVDIQFDPIPEYVYSLKKSKDDSGNFILPDKIELQTTMALIPNDESIHDITAGLTYDYAYRHVERKANTIYEWDDKVKYFTGSVTKKVTLLIAKDMIAPFCCIRVLGKDPPGAKVFFKLKDNTAGAGHLETTLSFPDKSSADSFIKWLISYKCADADLTKPIVIGKEYQLFYRGAPVTKDQIEKQKNLLLSVFEYSITKD